MAKLFIASLLSPHVGSDPIRKASELSLVSLCPNPISKLFFFPSISEPFSISWAPTRVVCSSHPISTMGPMFRTSYFHIGFGFGLYWSHPIPLCFLVCLFWSSPICKPYFLPFLCSGSSDGGRGRRRRRQCQRQWEEGCAFASALRLGSEVGRLPRPLHPPPRLLLRRWCLGRPSLLPWAFAPRSVSLSLSPIWSFWFKVVLWSSFGCRC